MRFGHLVKVSLGTTPAWAGKSGRSHHLGQHVRDHPRMGGEKAAQRLLSHSDPGSPPHGRGKGIISPPFDNPKRITPAWAGKSATSEKAKAMKPDHPRMGGEKNIVRKASFDPQGSPPHGRGKGRW